MRMAQNLAAPAHQPSGGLARMLATMATMATMATLPKVRSTVRIWVQDGRPGFEFTRFFGYHSLRFAASRLDSVKAETQEVQIEP